MYAPFDTLTDQARLWLYQSSREFNEEELSHIKNALESFVGQWAAHGKDLSASFKIFHNRFIALAVDEENQNATGCSIDSSVAFIKSLGNQLNVDLFDRTLIAYSIDDKIEIESLNTFKNKVKSGVIPERAKIFNNAITQKGELATKWHLPLTNSWAGRFLPSAAI